MKLVPRLSLVLVGAMAIVLSGVAELRVRDDNALYEDDVRRDHAVTGHVLRTSVRDVWDSQGPERAKHLVESANRGNAGLRFRWTTTTTSDTGLSPDDLAEVTKGHDVQRVLPGVPEGSAEVLASYFAVRPDTPSYGVLELREPLSARDAHARATRLGVLATLATLLGVFLGIAMLVGRRFVGAPVDALVAKARRIGEGDLTTPVTIEGPEELRVLGSELNAMCTRLAQAQEHAASEADARVRATEQLRHADRLATVGKLAAGVAHEMGTPLSVVSGHAQMIAEREVTGEKVIESARIIDQQVSRVTGIVRQLLDFARRDRRHEGRDGTVDVLQVADDTTKLLEPAARKKGITMTASRPDGDGAPAEAAIPGETLAQIVTNLLVNAIHATAEGGKVEVIVTRTEAAPPGTSERRAYVRLDVADDGSGIPDDVLPHVFEPFFTTKAVGDGSGLGLSVVHGMVDDAGGFITVDTVPRAGTTFSVYLPTRG